MTTSSAEKAHRPAAAARLCHRAGKRRTIRRMLSHAIGGMPRHLMGRPRPPLTVFQTFGVKEEDFSRDLPDLATVFPPPAFFGIDRLPALHRVSLQTRRWHISTNAPSLADSNDDPVPLNDAIRSSSVWPPATAARSAGGEIRIQPTPALGFTSRFGSLCWLQVRSACQNLFG